MGKLKVFEMFAGYGGASFALKAANINHEVVGFSEIKPYSVQTFKQNHGNVKNWGDCTTIDGPELPDFDLLTGGFPCQDVSMAGKRDLSQGRTLLIHDVFRIIKAKQPKYLFLENVEGLLSMTDLWESIRYTLRELGYHISFKLLKTSDFNVPHTRPRVWIFCKRVPFVFMEPVFPNPIPMTRYLKDILEPQVDDKYYVDREFDFWNNIMSTTENKINIIGRVKNKDGSECKFKNGNRLWDINGVIGTLTCGRSDMLYIIDNDNLRKITPKEAYRLMGFLNDEIDLTGISESCQYEMAGNGWDINVVRLIFENIFREYKNDANL